MQTRGFLSRRHRLPIRIPSRPTLGRGPASASIRIDSDGLDGSGDLRGRIATDLRIENREPRAVEARISFVPGNGQASEAVHVTLEPLGSLDVPDVFARWFGNAAGSGTLSLETDESAAVTMTARTYALPGGSREPGRLATGLAESDDFSTDVEALNPSSEPLVFGASLYSRSGALLGTREGLALDAGQNREWSLRELFPEAAGEGLTLRIASPAGGALPTTQTTVTDLRTESRWTLAAELPVERLYLPAAGRTAGAGGTYLSTDVTLANSGERASAVTVRFLERDLENAAPASTTLLLGPRESRAIDDVIGALFGMTEVSGFLEVSADEPVIVAAESETARADGIPGGVGAGITAITPMRFSSRSDLRSSAAGLGSLRVELLNPGQAPLPVILQWLDAQGRILAETASLVPGRGSVVAGGDEPAIRGATSIVIESDRPHFAFPVSAGKILALSGDASPRERVIR
jgi:hypothetical protein